MAKHRVQMSEPKHDIARADIDFWIHSGEKQLGHLHISQGGVDWYEGKSSKNKRFCNWDNLAKLLEEHVPRSRAAKPKRKRKA